MSPACLFFFLYPAKSAFESSSVSSVINYMLGIFFGKFPQFEFSSIIENNRFLTAAGSERDGQSERCVFSQSQFTHDFSPFCFRPELESYVSAICLSHRYRVRQEEYAYTISSSES